MIFPPINMRVLAVNLSHKSNICNCVSSHSLTALLPPSCLKIFKAWAYSTVDKHKVDFKSVWHLSATLFPRLYFAAENCSRYKIQKYYPVKNFPRNERNFVTEHFCFNISLKRNAKKPIRWLQISSVPM